MRFGFWFGAAACCDCAPRATPPAMDVPRKPRRENSAIALSFLFFLCVAIGADLRPRRHAAPLRPCVVVARYAGSPVRHLGGEIVQLRSIGFEIVKFPTSGVSRNELPFAVERCAIPHVLPIELAIADRFALKHRQQTLALHRLDRRSG